MHPQNTFYINDCSHFLINVCFSTLLCLIFKHSRLYNFANNFDITWHNTFMQSAATQLLLQVTEYLLSINFSWFLQFSKLSLAWEAITVMIKSFSFGCGLYIVNLDLTLLFHIMVCHTVLIRVFYMSWVTCFALLVRTQRSSGPT